MNKEQIDFLTDFQVSSRQLRLFQDTRKVDMEKLLYCIELLIENVLERNKEKL